MSDPAAEPMDEAETEGATPCPQHGTKYISVESGFGGWQKTVCKKCHRVVDTRKVES